MDLEMAKRFVVVVAVLAVSGVLALAQQKPQIKSGVIQRTDPTNAQQMFSTYCATCHGLSGKGDGPAAAALKKAPADLTRISARRGGKFPTVEVTRYIRGADEVPAHGNRDMPVWGDLFRSLDANSTQAAQVRVNMLVEYLQKMQQP